MAKHIVILLALLFAVSVPARDIAREQADPAAVQTKIEAGKNRFERVKRALQFVRQGDKRRLESEINNLESQFDAAVSVFNSSPKADADVTALAYRTLGILTKLRLKEMAVFEMAGKRKLASAHVKKAIERTDRALQKADKAVQKAGSSADSYPALRKASEVQENAKQALADNRLLEAFRLTIKAREILVKAVVNALDADDMEAILDREKAYWDETNEMIENAESEKETRENLKAIQILERAKKFQERASRMLDAEKPLLALKESRAARRMVMGLRGETRKAERISEHIDRIDAKFNQVLPRVSASSSAAAKTLLLNGEEHLKKAKALAAEGKEDAASAQLLVAAKLIARAVDALEE